MLAGHRFLKICFGRTLIVRLLGGLLALQLVAPVTAAPRPKAEAGARLAALAIAVGHVVKTCHDDDGRMPAEDGGACCPCVLCHALSAACLLPTIDFAVALPIMAVGGAALFPQPPPHAPAIILGLSGPRGPPAFL